MKLSLLHESITPEPRSAISNRIMAIKDKVKLVAKDAQKINAEDEINHINELLVRAQKNRVGVLASKIISKAEEHLQSIIARLMRIKQKKLRLPKKQNIKDTAKIYLNTLPTQTKQQILGMLDDENS